MSNEWENQEWRGEFAEALGPEFWMWVGKAERDQIIKELLDENVG